MARVLVVEDDAGIRKLVVYALKRAGFEVFTAADGQGALDSFELTNPDLIILDLLLPQLSGFEVCQRLRAMSDTPILMVTALTQEDDIVRGLEQGADDYLTKPFSVRILLARVNALLRRSVREDDVLTLKELTIDFARCEARVGGRKVELTPTEFRILGCLARNAGRVVTSRVLLRQAQEYDCEEREAQDIVKVHIRRLRSKLNDDTEKPRYIRNVRRFGYILDDDAPCTGTI